MNRVWYHFSITSFNLDEFFKFSTLLISQFKITHTLKLTDYITSWTKSKHIEINLTFCVILSLQMCLHAWWKERGFFPPDLLIRAFLRTSSLLFLSREKTFFYLLFAYARLNCLEFAYLHTFFSLLRNSVYVSALSFQFFLLEKGIERTISF